MKTKWSFDDQDNWIQFENCNKEKQSPINILTESVVQCKTLCKLAINYKPSKCKIYNENNIIGIHYDKGSYIKFKDELYNLELITIHTPSLHKINGESFDMEVCLYHSFGNKFNDDNQNNGVILCCMYRRGGNNGLCNMFMNDIIHDIPTKNNLNIENVEVYKKWSAELLIPQKKSFFLYDGSIPFPPCQENFKVIVFENIGSVGNSIIDNLQYNVGQNSRKINTLGDRTIFYNPGEKIDNFKEKPLRNFDVVKDDKYLRCVKIKRGKKEEVVPEEEDYENEFVDEDMSPEDQKKYRNNIVLYTIILLFINCFFIIKWLYKHDYMIRFLKLLEGGLTGGSIVKGALFNVNQMMN